ncbi:PIN domain-containing protein [Bacteroidia bacterium]|nr:PIN domain-containing protein [Bacteroidia bacterium]
MQKLILDTNVVVSALIQKSYPHYIIYDYVFRGGVQLCLSKALFEEYQEVLFRPKFARFPDFTSNADIVLNQLAKIAVFYKPKVKLQIIKDLSDNKLLELADESHADFLITGNSVDFTMSDYNQTRILSPRSFWEEIHY